MSIELETRLPESLPASDSSSIPSCKVIRRDGSAVLFEPNKIAVAMTKAFIAAEGGTGSSNGRSGGGGGILSRNSGGFSSPGPSLLRRSAEAKPK